MQKTITVCDIHPDADHEARERRVGVNGKWVLMDVCDGFMDLVQGIGRPANGATVVASSQATSVITKKPANGTKKKRGATKLTRVGKPAKAKQDTKESTFPCFMCPTPLNTASSFQGHVQLVHGFPTASKAVGPNCPLCNVVHGRLTNHAKEAHNLPHVSALFAEAIKQDDPHGVVARQRKLGQKVDV